MRDQVDVYEMQIRSCLFGLSFCKKNQTFSIGNSSAIEYLLTLKMTVISPRDTTYNTLSFEGTISITFW